MPNTTSGTTTFDKNFSIDEVIEEAYQRVGIDQLTGYQIKSARRSLNIMFQEWANRGLHYWELKETNIDLVENQAEYHFLEVPQMTPLILVALKLQLIKSILLFLVLMMF